MKPGGAPAGTGGGGKDAKRIDCAAAGLLRELLAGWKRTDPLLTGGGESAPADKGEDRRPDKFSGPSMLLFCSFGSSISPSSSSSSWSSYSFRPTLLTLMMSPC